MSRSVPERLRELEHEVHDLKVLPAAAVRARGQSRRRRQLAAVTAACAVVATAGIAFAWPQQRTMPTGDRPVIGPGVTCVLRLPDSPDAVKVRVLDGGARAGLPDATVAELRTRRFTVLTGKIVKQPETATTLRYGPAAIGAATVLRASLYGDVAMWFDPERRDETIDLTLGRTFTRLATITETNQNLATAGEPTLPPQCSTAAPRTAGR